MSRTKKILAVGGAIAALGAGGAAIAGATGGDSGENAKGPGADKATAAALELTGGGTANSVERDGENGATWEVEVTKPDGSTVDVRLDDQYNKVVIEGDSESSNDAGQ